MLDVQKNQNRLSVTNQRNDRRRWRLSSSCSNNKPAAPIADAIDFDLSDAIFEEVTRSSRTSKSKSPLRNKHHHHHTNTSPRDSLISASTKSSMAKEGVSSNINRPKIHEPRHRFMTPVRSSLKKRGQRGSLSTVSSSGSSSSEPPFVRFDKIRIHEFPLTIGDNPSVREGPPVALSRHCCDFVVLNLERFESVRSGHRRRMKELQLDQEKRRSILVQSHSMSDILQAEQEASIARQKRMATEEAHHGMQLQKAKSSRRKTKLSYD